MIILGLDVVNFRNIKKASLAFSETFNFISGRNAQGKTNLIEAIHLFSLGRSFRTRRTEEAVTFGADYFFLRLTCRSDSGIDFRIEIGLERGGKVKASVNSKKLSSLSEIIGIIPSVIFTPEDVMLAAGPPAQRRMYIDYTAAQISPAFLSNLKEYRKVLRQRNSLLKTAVGEGREPEGLEAWDEMLIEKGEAVVAGRGEMLAEITSRAGQLYREIVPCGETIEIVYLCSFDPAGRGTDGALREELGRVRDAEMKRGYTLAGPHFDDIVISLDATELRKYGSQGRKRLTAIVLKLAQATTIMERRGERPVVLLDDIFSELDAETSRRVRDLLSDRYQSFITSPRLAQFRDTPAGASFFVVEGGGFTRGGAERDQSGA